MAKKIAIPEARSAMEKFKIETANELGVNFSGYNGDLTAKQCGSVGGEMVKKMVEAYQSKSTK